MPDISNQSPFIIAISDFIPIIDEDINYTESELNDLNNYLEIETFKELFDNNLENLLNDFSITDEILNNRYLNINSIKNLFDNKKKNFEDELKIDTDIINYLNKIVLQKSYIEFLYKNLLDLSSNSLLITNSEIQNIISKYDNIFLSNKTEAKKKFLFDQKQLIKYSDIDIDNLFFDTEINLGFINNVTANQNLFNNTKSILLAKLFDELKKNIFSHQSNKEDKIIDNKFNNISEDRINLSSFQHGVINIAIVDFFDQNFQNVEDYNFDQDITVLKNAYVVLKNKNDLTSTNTFDKILYSYTKILVKELNFSSLKKNTPKIDNKIDVDINMFSKVFGNYSSNFFSSNFNETGYLNDLLYFKNINDNNIVLNLEFNYFNGNFSQNNASRNFISGKDEYLDSIEFSSGVDNELETTVVTENSGIKIVSQKIKDLISTSIPDASTSAIDIIKENLSSIVKEKIIIDEIIKNIDILDQTNIGGNTTIEINQKIQNIIEYDQNLGPVIQEILNSPNFSGYIKETINQKNINNNLISNNLVNQNMQFPNASNNSNLGQIQQTQIFGS